MSSLDVLHCCLDLVYNSYRAVIIIHLTQCSQVVVIPRSKLLQKFHKMALAMVRRNLITHYTKFASSWSVLSRHSSIHNPSLESVSPFHSQSGGGGGGGGGLPSYMRGAVYWEPNKPLSIEEFHMPRPKAGEVLIKTKGKGTL